MCPGFGKMSYISIRWSAESLLSIVTSVSSAVSCTDSREPVGAPDRAYFAWHHVTHVAECGTLNLTIVSKQIRSVETKSVTVCTSPLQSPITQCIFSKSRSIRKTPYQFHGRRSLSTVCLCPFDFFFKVRFYYTGLHSYKIISSLPKSINTSKNRPEH